MRKKKNKYCTYSIMCECIVQNHLKVTLLSHSELVILACVI